MKKEIYNLEGIEIEVEKYDKSDKDAERRRLAYCFKMIREKSGMSKGSIKQIYHYLYRIMSSLTCLYSGSNLFFFGRQANQIEVGAALIICNGDIDTIRKNFSPVYEITG